MSRTTPLTKAAASIRRQLLQIAAPLVLGSILQQFYNAADAWIIGHYLGPGAYAAAGVGGTIMNLFIFVLSGCTTGASILLSQRYGARDLEGYRRTACSAAVFGLVFALVLTVSGLLGLIPLLRIMETPAALMEDTARYLQVILAALPLTLLYNLYAACLRSVGDTAAALWILALSILANTALDVLFVGPWAFGIAGAALATAAAQLGSVLLCLFYMRREKPELFFGWRDLVWDGQLFRQVAVFGLVSSLQQSSLYLGKLLVMRSVNLLGTEAIRGYTAALRLEGFANSFGDGGAAAVSVLIAQHYGAGDRDGIQRGLWWGLKLHALSAVVLSALLFTTAAPAVRFMLNGSGGAALSEGIRYLRLVAVFYLLNFIGCAFVGFFRGVGYLRAPMIGSTTHIILRVILTHLFAPRLGLAAAALATGAGWVVAVTYHTGTYFHGRWRRIGYLAR